MDRSGEVRLFWTEHIMNADAPKNLILSYKSVKNMRREIVPTIVCAAQEPTSCQSWMAGDLSLPCETLAAERKRKQENNEDTKLVNFVCTIWPARRYVTGWWKDHMHVASRLKGKEGSSYWEWVSGCKKRNKDAQNRAQGTKMDCNSGYSWKIFGNTKPKTSTATDTRSTWKYDTIFSDDAHFSKDSASFCSHSYITAEEIE